MGSETILRFALHDALEIEAARRTHELMIRDALTAHGVSAQRIQSEAAGAATPPMAGEPARPARVDIVFVPREIEIVTASR